jgi:hypothetical protein
MRGVNMAKPPILENWRKLYKTADEFKNMECWDWMYDSDLFGVQNPKTGEIGYCCVMGHLGEHLALAVYLGTEGLDTYIHLTTVEPETAEPDDLFSQNCLQVSFEDREQLVREDREIIKKLGLKYRGAQNWPMFRDYTPGYMPWFLNNDDVEFFTLAIEQAMEVCGRVKEHPDLLDVEDDDLFLVRVAEKKGKSFVWRDEWLKPLPPKPVERRPLTIDQFRLQKISQSTNIVDAIWEFDYFYLPRAVQDGKERPYFPLLLLWGDHESLFIFSNEMAKQTDYPTHIITQLLNVIERTQSIPEQVWVKKQEVFEMLRSVTSALGIKIKLQKQLTSINAIRDRLMNFLF